MRLFLSQLGIAFCGLITTVLVVLVARFLSQILPINPINISVWFIPVGAIFAGAIAASGYYFGAKYTHTRASWPLLIMMVLVAAIAEFLYYWLTYLELMSHPDLKGSGLGFFEFLSYLIDHQSLTIATKNYRPITTEVSGGFGFFLFAKRFVGFLAGGLYVFYLLRDERACRTCGIYLTEGREKREVFGEEGSAVHRVKQYFHSPMEEFRAYRGGDDFNTSASSAAGCFQVAASLAYCPVCAYRSMVLMLRVSDGEDWIDIKNGAWEIDVTGLEIETQDSLENSRLQLDKAELLPVPADAVAARDYFGIPPPPGAVPSVPPEGNNAGRSDPNGLPPSSA